MTGYIALLRKEQDSDYGVDFPDFPGCVTAGTSLEDARLMAAEALQLHLEGMQQDGASIPSPSTLDEVMADPGNRDTVAFLVNAAPVPPPTVRVNITLPQDVLDAIDRVSGNRSRFLADAAREKLRA